MKNERKFWQCYSCGSARLTYSVCSDCGTSQGGRYTKEIERLEKREKRLEAALREARNSLPPDPNLNAPWSKAIAIMDEALADEGSSAGTESQVTVTRALTYLGYLLNSALCGGYEPHQNLYQYHQAVRSILVKLQEDEYYTPPQQRDALEAVRRLPDELRQIAARFKETNYERGLYFAIYALDRALAQSGELRVPDITNGLEVTFDPRKLPRKPCRIRIDAAPEPGPEKE